VAALICNFRVRPFLTLICIPLCRDPISNHGYVVNGSNSKWVVVQRRGVRKKVCCGLTLDNASRGTLDCEQEEY